MTAVDIAAQVREVSSRILADAKNQVAAARNGGRG